MPYQDLRQFLDVLRKEGELIEIDRPMHLDNEIPKALKQISVYGGPALVFNKNGTDYRFVAGIYATRRKALLAFETTEDKLFDKFLHGLDHPIAPVMYKGAAPCQEVVLTGKDIDIRRFPIPTYSPKDGGPFITPAIPVTRDPETGAPDIGHYRYHVLGPDRLGFYAQVFHRFGKNIIKSQKLGQKLQGAILLGTDPVIAYACQVQGTDATNDWEVAGGLRGTPVELVKCRTVDVEVPATAEVVIEFEVETDHLAMEGPLGEFTGYYTPASKKPTVRITAITHRRNPYVQGLLTGKPMTENHILKQVPFEASFWRTINRQFPSIDRIAFRPAGGVQYYLVISMQPRFQGEARQAIMAALASNVRPKWVIVVEPDIDIYSSSDVEWAMSFRVQPDRDVFVMENIPATHLDPSVDQSGPLETHISSAVGIDATRPVGRPFADVADVPGWREFKMPELDRWRK